MADENNRKQINKLVFDGIQVSVNSDEEEEELDYEDDVGDDEADSMTQDQQDEQPIEESLDNSLGLGVTSANISDEQLIMNNPHLKRLLNKMLDERIKNACENGESSNSQLLSKLTPNDESKNKQNGKTSKGNMTIKSPSDTTIYMPALKLVEKRNDHGNLVQQRIQQRTDNFQSGSGLAPAMQALGLQDMSESDSQIQFMTRRESEAIGRNNPMSNDKPDVISKISNFVDQMRLDFEDAEHKEHEDDHDHQETQMTRIKSSVIAPGLDEAQRQMEQAIVETEKFKASVEKPPSDPNYCFPDNTMSQDLSKNTVRQVIGSTGITDDDFFHLTCHIDPSLKRKIESGEFVDLDKLLPKDNTFHGRIVASNETKLEWVQSKGSTYLVPAKNTSRVNCFRCWEQAFRMYATIYCTKNPNRAREIWQYISVINTASMSYSWDNVYNYDIVFRQLMEFNPNRSWAVTYNQMWNLSMTNPLAQGQGRRSFGGNSGPINNSGGGHNKKKLDYCWSFNKGVKCNLVKSANLLNIAHTVMKPPMV